MIYSINNILIFRNITINNYLSTETKKSTVHTPAYVSMAVYENLKRYPFKRVLDLGCASGQLSQPFKRKRNTKIYGLDITDEHAHKFDAFLHKDFLECTAADFKHLDKIDLILTNPPFGKSPQHNMLYPDLFLKKIIEIWGNIPTVVICGHWFLSNSSERINFLNSLNITRNTTLHKRTFENCGVSVESNILYFNVKQKTANDFLDIQKTGSKQKFKTVAFSHDQIDFIKNNIDNFSGEIKSLLREKYKHFPS